MAGASSSGNTGESVQKLNVLWLLSVGFSLSCHLLQHDPMFDIKALDRLAQSSLVKKVICVHALPTLKRFIIRVRPGVLETTATFFLLPDNVFRAEDLPTFERPASVISGSLPKSGMSRALRKPPINSTPSLSAAWPHEATDMHATGPRRRAECMDGAAEGRSAAWAEAKSSMFKRTGTDSERDDNVVERDWMD